MILIVFVLSLLSPALVLYLAFKSNEIKKSAHMPAFMVGLAMAVVFYGYVPDQGADIIRHIRWLTYYKDIPVWKCFDAGHYSLTYTWDIWSWLIAQTNNEKMLQASGAFIGYSLASFIVFDAFRYVKGKNKKRLLLSFFIMICMISPTGVAIGIRNTNAFIICGIAFYLFYSKKIHYIGLFLMLIAGTFLHHAALLAVILWVTFPIFKKYKRIVSIISFIICLSFGVIYSRFLLPLVGVGQASTGTLFEDVVDDAYIAFRGRDMFRYTSLNSTINKWVGIALVFLIIINNNSALKRGEEDDYMQKAMNELHNLSIFIFVVAMGLSVSFTLNGNRFIGLAGIVAIAPLTYSVEKSGVLIDIRRNSIFDTVLLITALVMLLLHMHSLNYGTGSLLSLMADGVLGIIWPIITGT